MKVVAVKGSKLCAVSVVITALAVFMIFTLDSTAQGALQGIDVCLNVLIPSLFPFMAVSNMLVMGGSAAFLGRLAAPLTGSLFRLPGEAGAVILAGLFGGFPAGCAGAAALRDNGVIDDEQAELLMLYCINGGPAFTVTAVGIMLYGSALTGTVIFIANVLAALTLGMVLPRIIRVRLRSSNGSGAAQISSGVFVKSVTQAGRAMFTACAFVVFFFSVSAAVKSLDLPLFISNNVFLAAEVTSAVQLSARLGVPVTAAVIGWGGLCVHLQLFGIFKRRINFVRFFVVRAFAAMLSYVYAALLIRLFPQTAQVFSNASTEAVFSDVSVPFGLSIIFMTAVFVLSFSANTKIKVDFSGDI